MRTILALLLIFILNLPVSAGIVENDGVSGSEARQARKLIKQFNQRMLETKDLAPVIDQLFVDNYREIVVNWYLEEFNRRDCENQLLQLSRDEIYQFYITQVNFFYLTFIYCAGNFSFEQTNWVPDYIGCIPFERRYPPGVAEILKENARLAVGLNPELQTGAEEAPLTLSDIHDQLTIMARAVKVMREYLQQHKLEQTELFRKNQQFLAQSAGFLYLLSSPWYEDDGKFIPAGTKIIFTRLTEPLKLNFVRQHGKLKILFAFVTLCD